MAFQEIAIESLDFNPFTKISKEWMLVTAGDEKKDRSGRLHKRQDSGHRAL